LTAYFEKTKLSEKMIEEDLSQVEKSATKSTYRLSVGFEMCEDKGGKSAPKFITSSNYHQEEKTIKSTKAHNPSNPKPPFNPKREVKRETPKLREEAFACIFCGRAGDLMSFASVARQLRGGALNMLETHIMMSSSIFRLVLILVLCLTLLLILCLIFLIDLTIAHMILVHERIALCLNALVTTHVLIVVIVPRIGPVFLLELLKLTLS
jgi:hypothetical protein